MSSSESEKQNPPQNAPDAPEKNTTSTDQNAPDQQQQQGNADSILPNQVADPNAEVPMSDNDDDDDELGEGTPGEKTRRKLTTDVFAKHGGITLTWSHLTYKVKVANENGDMTQSKTILDNLSGCVRPGRLTAILGPSGGGKSSLTNAVTGRLVRPDDSALDGVVYLNDTVMTSEYKPVVSFVSQDDIVMPKETPVDAFRFSASIRNENLTEDQIEQRTQDMLHELKLSGCKDTIMGIPGMLKGVSGGEKRRTNIGVELINNPPVIFLDEPTSGLDSVAAYRIGKLMRSLAHVEGRTVVCTIHSPSSELFALFDDLILLAKGSVVYHGPAAGLRTYMECIGRPMPENINPIEYAMKLLQSRKSELDTYIEAWKRCAEEAVPGVYARVHTDYIDSFEEDVEMKNKNNKNKEVDSSSPSATTATDSTSTSVVPASQEAVDEFGAGDDLPPVKVPMDPQFLKDHGSDVRKCLAPPPAVIKEKNAIVEELLKDRQPPSTLHQLKLVCARSWRNVIRDPMLTFARIGQTVIFAIFIGLVFLNLEVKSSGVQDRQGLLFLIAIQMTFLSLMPGLMAFPPELAVFLQDQANGLYGPNAFYWAKSIVELPVNTISPTLFTVIIYFMSGLGIPYGGDESDRATNFFRHFCVIICLSYTSNALGMFLGAFAGRKPEAAFVYGPLVILLQSFVAGLFANTDRLEPGWVWLTYISYIRYAFKALTRLEFMDMGFICSQATEGLACRYPTGASVVKFLGFDRYTFDEYGYSILMINVIHIVFRLLGMAGLSWQSTLQHAKLVFKDNHARISKLEENNNHKADE